MEAFWAELKRRNVFKVGVAYAIVAWLLIQVAATVLPTFDAPRWVQQTLTFLIILGFPLALFFAWAFELTPEGIKPTQDVLPYQSLTRHTGQKLNYVIIASMALAITFLVIDNYVLVDEPKVVMVEQTTPSPDIEQAPIAQPPEPEILPNSVAVLPFESMNPDENNVWFAAGLHEEILNQLAKLRNLNIISRTTMLQYAGTDKPLPQIARELNVVTIMEGSVRYAGGRVRVTTQLIDPARNVHLWSETYEHELKDIFATESDIAMNVANALAVEFSPEEQARIEAIPTASPEAYSLYLEALGLLVRWTPDSINQAVERIDRALGLDPGFAEGWLLKGNIHSNATVWITEHADEHRAQADRALLRAVEIDPGLPRAYMSMALAASTRGEWQRIEEMRSKAISAGADENQLWTMHRFILGYLDEFRGRAGIGAQRNPLDAVASFWAITHHDATGNADAALAEYERGRQVFENASYGAGHSSALVTLMGMGDRERARDLAASGIWEGSAVFAAALANFDAPEKALAELHTSYESTDKNNLVQLQLLVIWAAWFGDSQLALGVMADVSAVSPPNGFWVWRPMFRDMRRDPGFKDLVRKLGFVDFWKNYGWPDLCKPLGEDDFACE